MHYSHGMGYAEYSQSHEKRMDVEMSREKDYHKSQLIHAKIGKRMKR